MIKLSDFELGWLVGILEGEGYFGHIKSKTYEWKSTSNVLPIQRRM